MQSATILGSWSVGYATATAGTAFFKLIPPWPGPPGGPPFKYGILGNSYGLGGANWYGKAGLTRLTHLHYQNGAAAVQHKLTIMRPKNWAVVTSAAAAAATTLYLSNEPGAFTTAQSARAGTTPGYGYRYPLPAGQTVVACTAANTIANTDYVCVQLKDGTWHLSKVTSWTASTSALVIATAIPNITGGGVNEGAILFWFANVGDTDPATAQVDPFLDGTAATTVAYCDTVAGLVSALHPGDPLLFSSTNGDTAGFLYQASGVYTRC